MNIRILPPNVAAQIAAGEVIERPASVVKELVENAIDAGATQITVSIEQGGTRSIRVQDNGSGIPGHQVETAFSRHATSKLRTADDLHNIATLGWTFRISSGVSKRIYKSVVQGDRKFLRIEAGRRQ